MKISIVTVAFNSGQTIADTIRSVRLQTYDHVEYIIVDGGSTDNTLDIIRENGIDFPNLKWISEKDHGLYDAINKGIQMATGDVVGILNSDDFYTSSNILDVVAREFSITPDIDAVYGDIHFVRTENLNKCVRYYSSKIFQPHMMRGGFMPAHPSFFVRRSCYEKYGLYKDNYKICGDFELLLRFIYVNQIRIKYLPLDMVTMRMGGVSTRGIKSHIKITQEHFQALRENNIPINLGMLFFRYLYKLTEFYKINRN